MTDLVFPEDVVTQPRDMDSVGREMGGFFILMGVVFLGIAACTYHSDSRVVVFALVGGLMTVFGIRKVVAAQRVSRENRAIRARGIAATATVVGLAETSNGVNGQPGIRLHVRITLPGQRPHDAMVEAVLPVTMIPRVQPGAVLPVTVDPGNPGSVLVEWSKV